jgi:tetratricopeptide (TPR) repeat protein
MRGLLYTITLLGGAHYTCGADHADAGDLLRASQSKLVRSWQQANELFRAGKLETAFQGLEAAVEHARAAGQVDPSLAGALNDLASISHQLGRLRDAKRYYEQSISLYESGEPRPGLAVALTNLALLHTGDGRLTQAEKLYQRAAGIVGREAGATSVQAAVISNRLAKLNARTGKYKEADKHATRALRILETAPGQSYERGISLFLLGTARRKHGQQSEGNEFIRQAIAEWAKSPGRSHPVYISANAVLAALIWKTDPAEAEQLFREAFAFYETPHGVGRPEAAAVLAEYSRFLRAHGRKGEAESVERRIPAATERAAGPRAHIVDVSELQARR